MNIELILLVLIFYLVFALLINFVLREKLKLINMIFNSKKPNKRNELLEERRKAKLSLKTAWIWPVLLIKAVKNGIKQKK